MKKLILFFLCCMMTALFATNTYAQNKNYQELTAEEIAQRNPAPKRINVKYAPNAKQPTLAEQIITTEKTLKQLYATSEAKRPVFIKNKIVRLEKELKFKKAQQKQSSTN